MLGKRLINTTVAGAAPSCTTDTLQVLGDTSCIAYYKMSDATDESGNYDGTPTSVNFNVAGKFGNAGSFNGSSSKIVFPSVLSGITNVSSYSCWFKITDLTIPFSTLDDGSNQNTNVINYIPRHSNGNYYITFGAESNRLIGTSPSSYSDGGWHHMVVTKSSSSLKFYSDGVLLHEDTSHTDSVSGLSNAQIAHYSSTFSKGSIDQVRIFNKALSSSEVTTLYNEVYCVPTIVPTDHFEPVIYTGNGTTQSITSLDFKPDMVWMKNRDNAFNHRLADSVSGATKYLITNLTNGESTNSQTLTSFDSNGFTVGSDAGVNYNNSQQVAWNWKSGGADVLNQDGTIDSQVSANVDAGFSIVKFTTTGSSNDTIGHGLSSKPQLILTKSTSASNWYTYSESEGTGKYLNLNTTDATLTYSDLFNTVTSSAFQYKPSSSAGTYIAYCFHSVDGYSKIGSYDGGTITSSNPVYLGFRPAFVMFKTTQTSNEWVIYDNKRDTTDPLQHVLYPNSSVVEDVSTSDHYNLYTTSNGFYFNNTVGYLNNSASDVIFMAFAEEGYDPNGVTRNATNPFGDGSELALYKFEDNATDAEGNYSSTTLPNVTFATGYIDKAAVFNGSSSRIGIPNIVNQAADHSVSLWIKPTNFNTARTALSMFNGSHLMMNITTDGGINTNGASSSDGTTAGTITANSWNHIVVTYNYASTTYTMYVNGVNKGTSANFNFSGRPSSIGCHHLGGAGFGYWFDGSIDQVRIFNRALDSGEVTQLYNE